MILNFGGQDAARVAHRYATPGLATTPLPPDGKPGTGATGADSVVPVPGCLEVRVMTEPAETPTFPAAPDVAVEMG